MGFIGAVLIDMSRVVLIDVRGLRDRWSEQISSEVLPGERVVNYHALLILHDGFKYLIIII